MTIFADGESGLSVRTKINNVLQHADGTSGELVINDAGADVDFRVESDTLANALFVDGATGNVSLGTSVPGSKLDIYGAAPSTGLNAQIINSTDTGGDNTRYAGLNLVVGSDASTASIRAFRTNSANDFSNALTFWTKGAGAGPTAPTERVRITAAGNVGIGTTAPDTPLRVVGVARATAVQVTGQENITPTGKRLSLSVVADSYGDIYAYDATAAASINLVLQRDGGNVGVGTIAPSSKLHVVSGFGGVSDSLRLQNDSTFATVGRGAQLSFRGTGGGLLATISGALSGTADDQGSLTYVANGATSYHAFHTNSAERVRIDTSGNVGIASTPAAWGNQSAAIQIGLSGALQSYKAGTAAEFMNVLSNAYNDNTNWRYIQDGAATRYEQNESVHKWFTSASGTAAGTITFTQAMTLTGDGNLGVGTTNPAQKLVINATTSSTANFINSVSYGSVVLLSSSAAGGKSWGLQSTANGDGTVGGGYFVITNQSDGLAPFRLSAAGNLGLGVTPNAASILDAQSTTKGVRFPNMTTTQKNAIANVAGNVIFDTDLGKLCVNTGSGWQTITSA